MYDFSSASSLLAKKSNNEYKNLEVRLETRITALKKETSEFNKKSSFLLLLQSKSDAILFSLVKNLTAMQTAYSLRIDSLESAFSIFQNSTVDFMRSEIARYHYQMSFLLLNKWFKVMLCKDQV
jgi:hypothetical protein